MKAENIHILHEELGSQVVRCSWPHFHLPADNHMHILFRSVFHRHLIVILQGQVFRREEEEEEER